LSVSLARPFTGDIASMRRNQQLLSEMTPVPQEILDLFNLGSVVVFTSHMIDHPHRAEKGLAARFPADPALEEAVVQAVREELQNLNVVVGYCSAACGSDILFAEQMRQRGAELHVVLPFTDEDFYITSVDFGLEEMTRWRQRCEDILNDKETEVHYATKEHYLGDDVLFEFTNLFTQGLAMNHASRIWSEPFALAVVDSASTSALGGTTSFLESWKQTNGQFRVIDLAELRSKIDWKAPLARSTEKSHQTAITAGSVKREIKAMLFADVKNFSQLSEEQAPTFFLKYLNVLAEVVQASRCKPVFCNTWGDGLYLVFNRVDDCADLALRLLDKVENMNWKELGLPPDTTVRMGLHAGPVYPGVDPLIEKKNFFGSHVNRAARIEPVTTPGCAFASEQFAALLTVEAGDRFICEFIGVEPLAKGYDRCPLYRLGRK
jgi:class 3 adenylate cyclase